MSKKRQVLNGDVFQKDIMQFFRMIKMAQHYPYFNDDAETKWKENNLNLEIENDMKMTARGERARWSDDMILEVGKIDAYLVHDIKFIQERGSSLPTVQCPPHTAAKEM